MKFFHAADIVGCDTFLRVDDIVSIVENETKDHIIVGMRNGEHYEFSDNTIRSGYTKAFPSRTTCMQAKSLATQFFEMLVMLDKFVK